jgi:nitrogen regulatory protein PII
VVDAIARAAYSKDLCDGRIFVTDVAAAANIGDLEAGVE